MDDGRLTALGPNMQVVEMYTVHPWKLAWKQQKQQIEKEHLNQTAKIKVAC